MPKSYYREWINLLARAINRSDHWLRCRHTSPTYNDSQGCHPTRRRTLPAKAGAPARLLGSVPCHPHVAGCGVARADVVICAVDEEAHMWALDSQGRTEAAGRSRSLPCSTRRFPAPLSTERALSAHDGRLQSLPRCIGRGVSRRFGKPHRKRS